MEHNATLMKLYCRSFHLQYFGGAESNGFGSSGGFGRSDRTNGTERFDMQTAYLCDRDWGYGQMNSFGGGEFSGECGQFGYDRSPRYAEILKKKCAV